FIPSCSIKFVSFSLVRLTALINPERYFGISCAACPTDNPQGKFCKYSDTLNSVNCSIGAGSNFPLFFLCFSTSIEVGVESSIGEIKGGVTSSCTGARNSSSFCDSERRLRLFLETGLEGYGLAQVVIKTSCSSSSQYSSEYSSSSISS